MLLLLQPLTLNAVNEAVASIAVTANAIVAPVLAGTTPVSAVLKLEPMLDEGNVPNSGIGTDRRNRMQAQEDVRRW